MAHIAPVHFKKLVRVFELSGFVLDRKEGDHLVYVKGGTKRPVVIPTYKQVPVFIIKNNLRSASISHGEYFRLLKI
ncbi:MAG: type II toxin-antitoxin system HicA family toxin [Candidatus Gottesmanbacteria bacterium]|nr:type II toxin-antitoxin system HicA family toxin [Candidatus Gottesmanbacteria bacterium]